MRLELCEIHSRDRQRTDLCNTIPSEFPSTLARRKRTLSIEPDSEKKFSGELHLTRGKLARDSG